MPRFADYQYPWVLKRGLRPVVRAVRYRGLEPADVLLASYPRSGSTWLRFLLTDIVTGQDPSWSTVNRVTPDVGRHRDAPRLLEGGGRLIKTHDRHRGPASRAIYVVRDVRDVLLSEYRSRIRAGADETIDEFLGQALTGRLSLFGSWSEHVRFWVDGSEDAAPILVVRFEDLRAETTRTLHDVADVLGLPTDQGAIDAAIAHNSLDRMKQKEDSALDREITRYGHERFVGEGAVRGWASKLDAAQLDRIVETNARALELLGYPLESA